MSPTPRKSSLPKTSPDGAANPPAAAPDVRLPAPDAQAAAPAAASGSTTPCPWCSAAVPESAATCPSCGASLRDAVDGEVAGVTQIDHAAVSRLARIKPGRLSTWLGAESTSDAPDLGGKLEPPSKEVLEEMLRLELAAIDAEIEAKATRAAAARGLPDDGSEAKPG